MQLGNHADATLSTYPSLDFREEKISNGVYHDDISQLSTFFI